jgi:hypothetical protein
MGRIGRMGRRILLYQRVPRRLVEHSPCHRPIVAYYFQSVREKRACHRAFAGGMRQKWPETSDGLAKMRKIITSARFTSHVLGQEL